MSNKQREFDFPRGSQLALLNRLTDLSTRARLALRCIDDAARGSFEAVSLSYADFVAYGLGSRETAKRAVADLVSRDLVIVEEVTNARGRQPNEYRIAWANLKAWDQGERPEPESKPNAKPQTRASARVENLSTKDLPPGSPRPGPRLTMTRPPAHHDPAPGSQCAGLPYTPITYGNEYKNPSNNNSGNGSGDFSNFCFSREVVEADFREVARAEELSIEAREAGLIRGEFDRLLFFALLVNTRRDSTLKNKGAALVARLRGAGGRHSQDWRKRPTDSDIEVARLAIKKMDYGEESLAREGVHS